MQRKVLILSLHVYLRYLPKYIVSGWSDCSQTKYVLQLSMIGVVSFIFYLVILLFSGKMSLTVNNGK